MYTFLEELSRRPAPFSRYTAATLWNDPHISQQMLAFHLDPDNDLASRNSGFTERSIAWITARFRVEQGRRICDFGCGPGLYALPLAEQGAVVTGIDFSARSIQHARQAARSRGLRLTLEEGDYLQYSTDQRYDLVTLINCDFCALSPAQRQTLLGIFRGCLAPGGAILLDVYTLAAFEAIAEGCEYGPGLMGGFWSAAPYHGFKHTFKYAEERVALDRYTIIE